VNDHEKCMRLRKYSSICRHGKPFWVEVTGLP
jgi:hypothetical protein